MGLDGEADAGAVHEHKEHLIKGDGVVQGEVGAVVAGDVAALEGRSGCEGGAGNQGKWMG